MIAVGNRMSGQGMGANKDWVSRVGIIIITAASISRAIADVHLRTGILYYTMRQFTLPCGWVFPHAVVFF